jgi:hypothetical protein
MSDRYEVAVPFPEKIPQPHGGAIYSGGVPGHRGGPGRTPSALRAAFRESLATRLQIAERIADDDKASNGDRLRALEFMGRVGLRDKDDDEPEGGEVTLRIIRDA